MVLKNDIGLIGDFVGTIPVMKYLASIEKLRVRDLHVEILQLFNMIDTSSVEEIVAADKDEQVDLSLDLVEAFKIADKKGLHMTQAHFAVLGLPVPNKPIRPSLRKISDKYKVRTTKFDYLLSPFSRSLPEDQRWQKEKWQDLVDTMHDTKFALIGSKTDDIDYVQGRNVSKLFNTTFRFLLNYMDVASLISVVTGTSHLAYANSSKNYLFCNQGPWGKNPDAIVLSPGKPITEITVSEVIKQLKQ
jgi:hypothetical protein